MSYNKELFIESEHEEWKWVPEYEGIYGCTKCGKVFSTHHGVKKLIYGKLDKDGYRSLILYKKNGDKSYKRLHRIVALCWVQGDVNLNVCHNDGDISNNHCSNLRYDTQKNNIRDKISHGTLLTGENHLASTLTKDEVLYILRSNESYKELAYKFNVNKSCVYQIKTGRSWKYVYQEYMQKG